MNFFLTRYRAMHHPTHSLKNLNASKCPLEDLIAWVLRHEWGPWTPEQMRVYQAKMLEIDRRWTKLMNNKEKVP